MVARHDVLEHQAAARAAGGVNREANANHDPENLDLQQVLGDLQGAQASRTGQLRRAPPQTTSHGQRNRPARFKPDGLLVAQVRGDVINGDLTTKLHEHKVQSEEPSCEDVAHFLAEHQPASDYPKYATAL